MKFFILEDTPVDKKKVDKILSKFHFNSFKEYLTCDKTDCIWNIRNLIPERGEYRQRFGISTRDDLTTDKLEVMAGDCFWNTETNLFALSHLIQRCSVNSYVDYQNYVNKYIAKYENMVNNASLPFYFRIKYICNKITQFAFMNKDATKEDIRSFADSIVPSEYDRSYITLTDCISSFIDASKISVSKNANYYMTIADELFAEYEENFNGYDMRFGYDKLVMHYNKFLTWASIAASSGSMDAADKSVEYIHAMMMDLYIFIPSKVDSAIDALTVFDKDDVANLLCITKFVYELSKAKDAKCGHTDDFMNGFNKEDRDFILSGEFGKFITSTQCPAANLYTTNEQWLKFATGYMRMIGG